MIFSIIIGVLFVITICIGFLTGGAEDKSSSLKRLFIGLGIVLFIIGIVAVIVHLHSAQIIDILSQAVKKHIGLPVINWTINADILKPIIWRFFPILAAVLVIGFLSAFACRRCARNRIVALGGIVTTVAIFYFCSMWVFWGIGTFLIIFCPYSEGFPKGKTLTGTMLFMLIFVVLWVVYLFFTKRSGWKALLTQIGILFSSCAVVWLISCAIALPYANYQQNRAKSENITPFTISSGVPEATKSLFSANDELRKKHPLLEIPSESIYSWLKTSDKSGFLPQERREYTLQVFDSPDIQNICRNYEDIVKYIPSENVFYLSLLNSARAYARVCIGRAALFKETNQEEKILPELMKITALDREILSNSPYVIVELVRIACRSMWYNSIVQIGPNDKQYAPIYREALAFMKSQKVHLPSESGYFLGLLAEDKIKDYNSFIAFPASNALFARGLSHKLDLKPKLAKLEVKEVFGWPLSDDNEKAALQGRHSIVIGTTLLALKLYRVEHGFYPANLSELVPDYLGKPLISSYTGNPLKYESDGKNFTLFSEEENNKIIRKYSSVPYY